MFHVEQMDVNFYRIQVVIDGPGDLCRGPDYSAVRAVNHIGRARGPLPAIIRIHYPYISSDMTLPK